MIGRAVFTLWTFFRVGLLRPGRPIRLLRQVTALLRWRFGFVGEFMQAARRDPHRVAVVDDRGSVTYRELNDRSTRLAHGLRELTHGRLPTIGLLCRNHADMMCTMIAAGKLGTTVVLLNTGMSARQLAAVVADQRVDVLVADADLATALAEAAYNVPRVWAWGTGGGGTTVDALVAASTATRLRPPRQPGRTIILTSGTTGTPKGARRPMPGPSAAAAVLSRIQLRVHDRMLISAPLFHTWGYASAQLALGVRATIVLRRQFDPVDTLGVLADERCTIMSAVPIMLQRLLTIPARVREAYNTGALRIVAVSGSVLPGDLATRFMDGFGDVLHNLYGSTEVSQVTIATPADMRAAPGTAGRSPYGTRLVLLDGAGRRVRPGVTGRIFVANNMLFDGYTNGATRPMLGNLMCTGDVGHLDSGGRLHVDGREDDLVISGGENVFPREVEDVLATMAGVAEVAVAGVADREFGQRLAAWLVVHPGVRMSAFEVREYVRERLARHCIPRDVHFMTALPRTTTGKVVVRELRNA